MFPSFVVCLFLGPLLMKTSHHVYQTPLALRSLNVTLNSHFFLLKIQFSKVLIPWMGSCLDWLLGLLEFRVFCKLTGLFRIEEFCLWICSSISTGLFVMTSLILLYKTIQEETMCVYV